MSKVVKVFTDGACSGNPGAGGWGAVLCFGDIDRNISGGEEQTTNNRMELTAVIKALELLKHKCKVEVTTDSKYVKNGIDSWIHNWKKNGWRTSNKKAVKNVDLWQRLDELCHQHDVEFFWVKGHAGHELNEKADELATGAIKQLVTN